MRFEVPFDLEVDTALDGQVCLASALDDLEKYNPEYFVSTKPAVDAFDVFLNEVVNDKNPLKNVFATTRKQVASERATPRSFRNQIEDIVGEQFARRLQLQNSQVEALISQETERRRIEAERIRRAEEERKRKEQERIKQEQERIRKEQEEARRKAEEKKRLELEQKQKEEERKRKEAEAAKLAKEKEAKRKAEEAKKKAQAEEEAKAKLANQNKSITNFQTIATTFAKYKQDIKDIKENVKLPMANDPPLLKLVNPYKRKLNAKFGQLSNSLSQWNLVDLHIKEILTMASNAPNQLVYKWLLNFVAKAIIDQAETEVITSPHMAIPLGMLAVNLLITFPELEYYLTARFVKKCPYILGYTVAIDTENGRYNMGWKRKDQTWEDEIKYEERVSGICSVWAVMTVVAPKDLPETLSFYSMNSSWSFIARLLNTDRNLLLSTHFTVAGNWWEASAKDFAQKYRKQGQKLLRALSNDWPLSVSDKKFPGAARLLIIGEEWARTGQFECLKPMEP